MFDSLGFVGKKLFPNNKRFLLNSFRIEEAELGPMVALITKAFQEFYSRWISDSANLHDEIHQLKSENAMLKEAVCELNPKASICINGR
ncbi:MAG: hypothetical protein PHY93_21420 [Bacteriovorax sp.]|nr:hypothetical protein [Bacteriovorax sp.]